jgi:hypothetical protein
VHDVDERRGCLASPRRPPAHAAYSGRVRRHRPLAIAALASSAVLLATGQAGGGAPVTHGKLRASVTVDTSLGIPIEGSLSFFRLRARDGSVVFDRGAARLDEALPVGRYRLASYQRTCSGTCDTLDPPSDRCARGLRIRRGRTLRVHVWVRFGSSEGCTMLLSSDRGAAQGAARRAAIRRVGRAGIHFRPAEWRTSCALRDVYWGCRVRANCRQCRGTLRILGTPARFQARRVRIGCGE